MITLRPLLFSLLCCIATASHANRPEPSPLSQAYAEADQVLVVRIVSGRTLKQGELDCGARYVGSVVRSFKGKALNSQVEFGPYNSLQMGAHYLVFLGNSARPKQHWMSMNGAIEQATHQWFESCKGVMAPMSISNHDAGAMLLDETEDDNTDSWLINWGQLIEPPTELKTSEDNGKVRIRLRDFAAVAKKLKGAK